MSADEPRLHTIRAFGRGQNAAVGVTHTFEGVAVTDFAAAYQSYLRLFGRAADMFPHHGEAVWRLTPAALCTSCTTLSVLGTPYSRWQWTTSMPAGVTSEKTDSTTASILTVARHCVCRSTMTTATRSRSSKIQRDRRSRARLRLVAPVVARLLV